MAERKWARSLAAYQEACDVKVYLAAGVRERVNFLQAWWGLSDGDAKYLAYHLYVDRMTDEQAAERYRIMLR